MKTRPLGIAYILMTLTVVVATLLILEVAFRYFPNKITHIGLDQSPPDFFRLKDPKVGWFLKPNQTIDWHYFNQVININSHGMRDIDREKKGSSRRCILLGDSMLRAFEVDYHQTFAAKLEQQFDREMLNFGVAGHGTTQAYTNYLTRAREFSADCIIYFFYLNDFSDNNRILRRYLYTDGASKYPFLSAPELTEGPRETDDLVLSDATFDNIDRESTYAIVRGFFLERSHAARVLQYIKNSITETFDSKRKNDPRPIDSSGVQYIIDKECCESSIETAFQQLETSIRLLKKATQYDGRNFIIVYLPHAWDYIPKDKMVGNISSFEFAPELIERIKLRLRDITIQLRMPILDPTTYFKKYKNDHNLKLPYFHFQNNIHYNHHGHQAVYEFLKENLKFPSNL